MKSYIDYETGLFVVAISHPETCRLMTGQTIGDRQNPFWAEAKVAVRPYAELDALYEPVAEFWSEEFIAKLGELPCKALFMTNMDVDVYVPEELARCTLYGSETIATNDILTFVTGSARDTLLSAMPANGLQIRFDNQD